MAEVDREVFREVDRELDGRGGFREREVVL